MKKSGTFYFMFLLAFLCFFSCAGHKRGYYSWPYTSDKDNVLPSPNSPYEMNKSKILGFNDFLIYISLKNEIQTSDMTYFLLLPVPESLEDKPQYDKTMSIFFISLAVWPKIEGMVIEPNKICLIIDGIPLSAIETRYKATKRINYWYDSDDHVRQLPLVKEGETLMEKNKWNYFAIYFKGQVPDVDQDINLDLANAIILPKGLSIPTILFKKVKYGKWYG